MKKHISGLLSIVLAALLLAACTAAADPNGPNAAPGTEAEIAGTVADFFPFLPDVVYVYEGNGLVAEASFSVFNMFITGDRVQRRVASESMAATEIIERADGRVTLVFGDPLHVFYDDISTVSPNMEVILLQEPLVLGQRWIAWEDDSILQVNGAYAENEITAVNMPLSTPAGDFEVIEVTSRLENGVIERYYYARGVGLVKMVYGTSIGEVYSVLAHFSEGTGVMVPANFHFPNVMTNEAAPTPRSLFMRTGTDFSQAFEEEMKDAPDPDHAPLLTENARINGIEISWDADRALSAAAVDISRAFVDELAAFGDGVQSGIIQGFVDTIGQFYGVSNVVITVEGEPFASGPFEFAPGEGLIVTDSFAYHAQRAEG